jgi:ribose/xylose/arabinose/galactoside ABC-type transport system permease subunit
MRTADKSGVLGTFVKSRYFILIVILLVEYLFFVFTAPYFYTFGNFANILRQVSSTCMMAIPITCLLLAGHMDLSVGSILGISGVITGIFLRAEQPIGLAIFIGLSAGTAVGLLNGFLIGVLKIQGLVVTIGMQVMVRGLCYILTLGRAVSGYPKGFFFLGTGAIFGLPVSIWVLLILLIPSILVLERGYIGRYLIAIGNNQKVARYSGINVDRIKVLLFAFCGFITSIASVFLIARISSAEATLGNGYELDVITAALIGGVDINGGSGKLQGAILGILIIGVLRNGLNMMGVSVIYQSIILGVLLLAAVYRAPNK